MDDGSRCNVEVAMVRPHPASIIILSRANGKLPKPHPPSNELKIFWAFLLWWELLRWMYVYHSHCVLSLAAVVRKGLISKTNGVSLRSASQPNFQGGGFRIMTRSRTGLSQSSPGVWVSVGDAFFSWSELANRVSSFSRCHLWTGPGPSCIGPSCTPY